MKIKVPMLNEYAGEAMENLGIVGMTFPCGVALHWFMFKEDKGRVPLVAWITLTGSKEVH